MSSTTLKKSRVLRLLMLLSSLILLGWLSISRLGVAQEPATLSPQITSTLSQIPHPEQPIGAKDTLKSNLIKQLADLLTPLGVKVDEARLIDGTTVNTTRVAYVRWSAYIGAPDFVEPNTNLFPAGRALTVFDRKKGKGPMSQRRSLSLMTDDLLIAAVDTDANLLWWTQIQDPRVLRSEGLDEKGQLTGRTLHRSQAELFITMPDKNEIKELRFYQIKWNGTDYMLEVINTVPF